MQDFCKKKDISLFNNLSQVDKKRLIDFAFLVLFQSGGDKKFAKEILINQGLLEVFYEKAPQIEVINICKKELQKHGYRDLEHWLENPNHIYIGRNLTFYVKGAIHSKWANPFSAKKYGRDECLRLYKEWIQTGINPITKKKAPYSHI